MGKHPQEVGEPPCRQDIYLGLVETYETLFPLVRPGGFILADNTLWDSHVIDPNYERDHQTEGIRRFNDHLCQDNRVEQVILPMRDGLTLIRKKPSP